MRAGTVVTAEFQGVVNTKRRPAVVVSSESYHRERPDAILAVVTSQVNKSNSSVADYVLQDWQTAGLNKPSAVRIFLFTLPQSKITEIGKLSERDWAEVQKRLRISLEV
jgi:mRNA interferase MazF